MSLPATSSTVVDIPHDILDEIAKHLLNRDDGRRYVVEDIRSCSLVDRAFAATFQPYLFQRTYISEGAGSKAHGKGASRERLLSRLLILKGNPLLRTYVKKLTVTLHDVTPDPHLALLLDHFTSLNSLLLASFTSGDRRSPWTAFHPKLRQSMTKLCNLPTLRRLDLSNFDSLPVSLFLYHDHLTSISLCGSRPVLYNVDVQPKDDRPSSSHEKKLELNISHMDPASLLPLVSLHEPFFARVGALKSIHYPSSDKGVNTLLEAAQYPSLESIDFTFVQDTSPNLLSFERKLDLSPLKGLKSLTLSTDRPKPPAQWRAFLTMVSAAFEEMDTRQLKELTLAVNDVELLFLSQVCNPELGWDLLDRTILSKLESRRLSRLETISIDIGIKRTANYIPIRVRNPTALIEDVELLPSFPVEKTRVVLKSNVGEVMYDSQSRKGLTSTTV